MSRLLLAMMVSDRFGLGVRESMALAIIHLYVQASVRNIAEMIGITEDNARAIIRHVDQKGLLSPGVPIKPVKTTGNKQGKIIKTWRLKPAVRIKLDRFEATGKLP